MQAIKFNQEGRSIMTGKMEQTTMGGPHSYFQTTHWSEVFDAANQKQEGQREALNHLLNKYWKPVYCYLYHKGYSSEKAKDLTQDFFCEVVLGRNLIQRADQKRGKFRTFLLTALDRYTADAYHKEKAAKRNPTGPILQLETFEVPEFLQTHVCSTPVEIFHYAWASETLSEVLKEVKKAYYEEGKSAYWELFYKKLINPLLNDSENPSLEDLCKKYDIRDTATASHIIITVKRRFRSIMRRYLRQFVGTDEEVEEEFREIFQILSKTSAG